MLDDLTWTCHVCKEERPDRFISVYSSDIEGGSFTYRQNVRYCNDRPACIEGAKTFSFFGSEK